MTASEINDLTEAHTALPRRRSTIARRMAAIELALVSMIKDHPHVLLAIEGVACGLTNAGQSLMAPET